jgi:hypothetical protein
LHGELCLTWARGGAFSRATCAALALAVMHPVRGHEDYDIIALLVILDVASPRGHPWVPLRSRHVPSGQQDGPKRRI